MLIHYYYVFTHASYYGDCESVVLPLGILYSILTLKTYRQENKRTTEVMKSHIREVAKKRAI